MGEKGQKNTIFLRDEAENIVVESKRAWLDVPLSSAFHAELGCRLYHHILSEATVPFPLNSILVLPRIPYDPRLILKFDSQKSLLLQIRVVLLMHKFHMLYPSPARIRCQYECHFAAPSLQVFPSSGPASMTCSCVPSVARSSALG